MLVDEFAEPFYTQPFGIVAAAVPKTVITAFAIEGFAVLLWIPQPGRRQDYKVAIKLDGIQSVSFRDHLFVQLLARADSHDLSSASGRNGFRDIENPVAGDFRNVELSSPHVLEGKQYQLNAFFEQDVEPRHALVGDGKHTGLPFFQEERDHTAPAAHDVAVTDDRELDVAMAFVIVGRGEQLVRAELGGTIQVDGRRSLVRAESDNSLHAAVHGCIDDILRAEDIGLDGLKRVVLGRGHLLERRGVNDSVDSLHRALKASGVPHVTDEETDRRIPVRWVMLGHLVLLQFVAREDHYALHSREPLVDDLHKFFAE